MLTGREVDCRRGKSRTCRGRWSYLLRRLTIVQEIYAETGKKDACLQKMQSEAAVLQEKCALLKLESD